MDGKDELSYNEVYNLAVKAKISMADMAAFLVRHGWLHYPDKAGMWRPRG